MHLPGTIETVWAILAALYAFTVAVTTVRSRPARRPEGTPPPRTAIVPIRGASPFLGASALVRYGGAALPHWRADGRCRR